MDGLERDMLDDIMRNGMGMTDTEVREVLSETPAYISYTPTQERWNMLFLSLIGVASGFVLLCMLFG